MEEGISGKKTIFVGNLREDVTAEDLVDTFGTFGDVIDVQLPTSATNPNLAQDAKHRGYGFVTFSSQGDALDAIDNMDMNEYRGNVLKVNLAKPQKLNAQSLGNRAVWESEEWLKKYAKPLDKSGGQGAKAVTKEDGETAQNVEDNGAMEDEEQA